MNGGRRLVVTLIVGSFVTMGRVWGGGLKPSDGRVFDRGTIALYNLMKLEGRAIELDKLASSLPTCPAEGYSMKELRDAALSLGLRVEGVRLPAGIKSPDRPALVFVKSGDHGHFVVVRPVGHTGRLVQILDLDRDPSVIDASALYTKPSWTGLALVPDTSSPLRHYLAGAAILGAAMTAIILVRRRRPRPGLQGRPD